MAKSIQEIRNQFPILQTEVYGKKLVYFDNAATAQRPQSVLELQNRICAASNANIHRAMHKLSIDATEYYEVGRKAVERFINADPAESCVIFTSGATAAFNLLATCFTERYIGKGDKVLVSEAEHHSNIVPWQINLARKGAELVVLPVDERGELRMDLLDDLLDANVKLVSIAHISNVLGVVNPIGTIISKAHAKGIPVAIDGAQGVVHAEVDVQKLDCDFYIFSGHKIYAPTGTGVLYGKRKFLEEMPPFMGGGDMVDTVTFAKTTYAELPLKYEAGTPNYVAASCYAPAIELAATLRESADIKVHERTLVREMLSALHSVEGLHVWGEPRNEADKTPVFSFTIDGTHPTDIAQLLDKMGVAVRSGLMCAEPLVKRFSETGMVRASLLPYNTEEEIDIFGKSLNRAVNMLR